MKFYVTYSKYVPTGDDTMDDFHGWASPRGWRWDSDPANAEAWSLWELKQEFFAEYSGGDTMRGVFSAVDSHPYTGIQEVLYLGRPEGITDASWSRVLRVLGGRA